MARWECRARPDQPALERDRDVRALRSRRPLSSGSDQGRLLDRARRPGRWAVADREWFFPARRGLSRALLRAARPRAARPLVFAAAPGPATIYDDGGAARRVQREAAGTRAACPRPAAPV